MISGKKQVMENGLLSPALAMAEIVLTGKI